MNKTVVLKRCDDYDIDLIEILIEDIYTRCGGPETAGKTVW